MLGNNDLILFYNLEYDPFIKVIDFLQCGITLLAIKTISTDFL